MTMGEWIKIQDYDFRDYLPKEDCMIWITRTWCTGERQVQKVDFYVDSEKGIEWDGTVAWMPDQEKKPDPYMGNDVICIQHVR